MRIASTETISMTLTYGVSTPLKRAERRGYIALSWSIQDLKPEFGGFVLVANQRRPPEDRQDGEVLYRWTPEQAVRAGEHKALVSLERIENKGWDHFYCKAFVARSEQDSSTLIVHPNTCIPFTSKGEMDVPDTPPIKNLYSPSIPRKVICPDPECYTYFPTIDMRFSDFEGAKPRRGDYNWFDKLWCLLSGRLKKLKPPRVDGRFMTRKLCPAGHQLPINAGLSNNFPIGMIGAAGSGKLYYITTLVHQLQGQTAEDLNMACVAVTDETNKRYRLLWEFLFGHRILIPCHERATPFIYDLTMIGGRLQGKEARSVSLILDDTTGDDLKRFTRYLGITSGLILLVDPLTIPHVRGQLPPKIVEPRDGIGRWYSSNELIANLLSLLHRGRAAATDKPFSLPLAVVITKCDLLADSGLIKANRLWSTDRRHIGCFDTQLHEDLAGMWGEFMLRWAPETYNCVNRRFPNHAFFGVSATGCNADEKGRYRSVSPWRVEDPLLWLLAKSGFLPAQ